MATKTVKQTEKVSNEQAIVVQSGLSLEYLTTEMAPFMESVNLQLESEDPATQERAAEAARASVGLMMTAKTPDTLAVRDRIAELYFAFLNLAARIRKGVQQAEAMARQQERLAECIRGTIEAWCLTSWDSKRITGNYRQFVICKNPDKVMVLDEAEIPEQYFDEVPATKVLNKTRLAEALKANEAVRQAAIKNEKITPEEMDKIIKDTDIPGAILETSRTRLDIR